MAKLAVWGASDDLIEIRCEGDLKVRRDDGKLVASAGLTSIDEEFGAWCHGEPYKGALVVENAEKIEVAFVECWYSRGTWTFGPGHQHNGENYPWPFQPAAIGPCSDPPYSVLLEMELPDGCTVYFEPVP
jgi:hypothetical protein